MVDGNPQPEVWVRTLGGHVGDIGQHVDGEAVLMPSRPGLFFLRELPGGTHAPGEARFRLLSPMGLGHMVPKLGASQAADRPPARTELVGRTLDDVAKIVVAERHAHAR